MIDCCGCFARWCNPKKRTTSVQTDVTSFEKVERVVKKNILSSPLERSNENQKSITDLAEVKQLRNPPTCSIDSDSSEILGDQNIVDVAVVNVRTLRRSAFGLIPHDQAFGVPSSPSFKSECIDDLNKQSANEPGGRDMKLVAHDDGTDRQSQVCPLFEIYLPNSFVIDSSPNPSIRVSN